MKDLYFKVLRHKATIPASVGVASFAAGATLGYFAGKRYVIKKIFKDLDLVVDEYHDSEEESPQMMLPFDSHETTEEFFARIPKDIFPEPASLDTAEGEIGEPPVVEDEIINIFGDEEETEWDYEEESKARTPDRPYVIHADEFVGDEAGLDQTTLTYYQADDILVDERNVPIYNRSEVVGDLKFGHGSNDKNIVYIRNEKLRAEFEVLLDRSSYALEVLGLDYEEEFTKADLKHSHKFRMDD